VPILRAFGCLEDVVHNIVPHILINLLANSIFKKFVVVDDDSTKANTSKAKERQRGYLVALMIMDPVNGSDNGSIHRQPWRERTNKHVENVGWHASKEEDIERH
jgi:hypothetical protein